MNLMGIPLSAAQLGNLRALNFSTNDWIPLEARCLRNGLRLRRIPAGSLLDAAIRWLLPREGVSSQYVFEIEVVGLVCGGTNQIRKRTRLLLSELFIPKKPIRGA